MDPKLKAKVDCALHELKTNQKHIEWLLKKLQEGDTTAPPASETRPSRTRDLEFAVNFVLEGLDPDGDSLSDFEGYLNDEDEVQDG